MSFQAAGFSDVGKKRADNQDRFWTSAELQCALVADGMGGHRGGEVASTLAVETISKSLAKNSGTLSGAALLKTAFLEANAAIYTKAEEKPELRGMGTTCTALLTTSEGCFFAQIGDSRAYFLQPGKIWQITRDHSLVQEKVRAGLLTREEAAKEKSKNIITRSVGFEAKLDVDVFSFTPAPGDAFLLCSDGITAMLPDGEILDIFEKNFFLSQDLQKTVQTLIQTANAKGGEDNITAVVVRI